MEAMGSVAHGLGLGALQKIFPPFRKKMPETKFEFAFFVKKAFNGRCVYFLV